MADVFALGNSTLNAFLYSDVGTEDNGCGLTIMSMLARLDKDPWAEAALWSRKSKHMAVDALTQSIVLMQLRQPDGCARSTALRLIELLPRSQGYLEVSGSAGAAVATTVTASNTWMLIGCAAIYLALSLAFGVTRVTAPNAAAVTPPAQAATLLNK